MKELEQLHVHTEIISRLRDEIVLLGRELTSAAQSKTAMISQLDHLTAIAMQMTKNLAAHEKEETVEARERTTCRIPLRASVHMSGFVRFCCM